MQDKHVDFVGTSRKNKDKEQEDESNVYVLIVNHYGMMQPYNLPCVHYTTWWLSWMAARKTMESCTGFNVHSSSHTDAIDGTKHALTFIYAGFVGQRI